MIRRTRYKNKLPGPEAGELIRQMWLAGAPAWAQAQALGIQIERWPQVVVKVRQAGIALPHRDRHHQAPLGWRARLDEILAEAHK